MNMLARLLALADTILRTLRDELQDVVEGVVQLRCLRMAFEGGDRGRSPDVPRGAPRLTGVWRDIAAETAMGEAGDCTVTCCGEMGEAPGPGPNNCLEQRGWRTGESDQGPSGGVLACRPDQPIA